MYERAEFTFGMHLLNVPISLFPLCLIYIKTRIHFKTLLTLLKYVRLYILYYERERVGFKFKS